MDDSKPLFWVPRSWLRPWRRIGWAVRFLAGPLLGLLVGGYVQHAGLASEAAITAAITAWCAVWWFLEPLPLSTTSLLPLVVFPISGILNLGEVVDAYTNSMIILMLGGLMLSRGMERSGAHRRLALWMISLTGRESARRVVWGFMLSAAMLSMWISNMATTLMLVPVALAVCQQVSQPKFTSALMLGLAYSASIGGVGTPIGTPPNLIFLEAYRVHTGKFVTFSEWMSWGIPVIALMLPTAGFWLTLGRFNMPVPRLPDVGRWRSAEKRVLCVYSLSALLWITRTEPWGGWSHWLNWPQANDAMVAVAAALVLLLTPTGDRDGQKLLDLRSAASIPWGILVLFGGGVAIAKGFIQSGLSQALGDSISGLCHGPLPITIASLCTIVTFMTEVTSNMATASLLMPTLAAAAEAAKLDLRLLMVPATVSVSFAFMLPVATAPNIIVMGAGRVPIRDMVRAGLALNLSGVPIVTLVCWCVLPH